MKDKTSLILKDKKIMKSLLLLSLPIMASNILKSLHDIVDMYFVSNIDGTKEAVEAQVSAITVTGPIIMICQALALGLMVAGSALMSQYIGANKIEKAKKVSGHLLLLCTFIGIFFNILLYFLTPSILIAMGSEVGTELFKYSVYYVRYRSFELLGLFVLFSFQATRQSTGDTVTPVILNAITIILNIILTYVFIQFFGMDIRGAALATVISNVIIIPFCIVLMIRKENNILNLSFKDFEIEFKYIKKLFILGIPAAISHAFTSLGFLLINSLVIGFDNYIISAIGVGNRINSLLLYPAMSVGSVLATFVGQNIGAGQIERAKKSLWESMKLGVLITGIGSIILMFLREPMVSIFIKKDLNPEAFEMCVYYLYFLLVGLPLMAIFQMWNGCFQGAGRTELSLILSAARLWVFRLPLIWFLMNIIKIGPASVWYAMVISNFGAVILGFILYWFVDFKPKISKMKLRMQKIEKEDNIKECYNG